ncbi:MAG: Mur ligase domain-containing protein [Clostridia bacterium]|nr:Mur ligase domain-containing protein [Clostridia bacterium]MDD4685940.1 Mur ligase domain-containing protein [Clostridia bacterium]
MLKKEKLLNKKSNISKLSDKNETNINKKSNSSNKKKTIFKYHFIGIGGISMSALARYLVNEKHIVSGSDINPEIKLDGIKVFAGHSANNVGNCDFVVYNTAITDTNPEIIRAKEKNITLLTRAELLAEIASKHKNIISISGVHGKTTTTEMIAEVFIQAGLKPTVHLGGISNCFNSNVLIGDSNYFITEACEYKNSFLTLKSTLGVILNIEPEHLDFFKTFCDMQSSFRAFAYASKSTVSTTEICPNKTILFKNKNGYDARNISTLSNGKLCFDCYYKNKFLDTVILNALGIHNIDNALACIATCRHFKIKLKHIKKALKNFKGVKRRMEIIQANPLVIHDYAHHPTELISSITAIKNHFKEAENFWQNSNIKKRKLKKEKHLAEKYKTVTCSRPNQNTNSKTLIVVFQPHTYSRTATFKDDFINALNIADKVYIFKTYAAREDVIKGASAFCLYQKLHKIKKETYYYKDFLNLSNDLKSILNENTILLILGAGDIYKLGLYFS